MHSLKAVVCCNTAKCNQYLLTLPFRATTTSVLPGFMPYMYSQLFKQQRFIIVMRDPVLLVRSGLYYFNKRCSISLKKKGALNDYKVRRYWLHLAVLQHTTAFNKCMELTQGDGSMCIYDYKNHIVPDKRIPSCIFLNMGISCLLYTSPSPRDRQKSRMPSSA